MRKIVVLMIITLIFQACTRSYERTEETQDNQSVVTYTEQEGYIDTTLLKVDDLSPFKKQEAVDMYLTAPEVFVTDGKAILIRNYPENLPDGPGSYTEFVAGDRSELKREITILDLNTIHELPEYIYLPELAEKRMTVNAVSHSNDGVFTVLGREKMSENEYQDNLYILNEHGDIIKEKEVFFEAADLYFVYDSSFFNLNYSETQGFIGGELTVQSFESDNISVIADNVICFTVQEDHLYYITKTYNDQFDISSELYEYNILTKTIKKISSVCINEIVNQIYTIKSFSYDAINGILYIAGYDTMISYDVDTEMIKTVFTILNSSVTILQATDDFLIIRCGNNQVSLYQIPDIPISINDKKQTLRVCWYTGMPLSLSAQRDEVLKIMKANGISIVIEEVVNSDNTDEYVNTVAKKLLAGDEDFDMIYIDTSMSELMEAHYFCDLRKFDVLNKQFEYLLPDIQELCTINNELIFVPTSVYTTKAQIQTSMLAVKPDVPKNFVELLNMKSLLTPFLTEQSLYFMSAPTIRALADPWFEQIISNYMAGNSDEQKLRADLTRIFNFCIEMIDDPTICISSNNGYQTSGYYSMDINTGYINVTDKETIDFAVPLMNDDYSHVFSCRYLAVNPNSPNRELAVLFLAYCMEYDKNDNDAYGLAYMYQSNDESTKPSREVFYEQLNNSVRNYQISGINPYLNDKFNQIQNGYKSVELVVDEVSRYLKMIREE